MRVGVAALARALASPEHHHRLRVGAWKVARRFSLEAHLAALEPALQQAAGRPRPRQAGLGTRARPPLPRPIRLDYACQNRHLLTDILKRGWDFGGFVVSDWFANHSTIASANAGLDLEMPGGNTIFGQPAPVPESFGAALKAAVQNRQVRESRLNDMVRRILDHLAPAHGYLHASPG